MRYLRIISVLLAVTAVFYIAYDYSAGHMDARPWDIIHCPICNSYISTNIVSIFDCESICIGLHHLIGFLLPYEKPYLEKTIHATISHRGPPLSSCKPIFMSKKYCSLV